MKIKSLVAMMSLAGVASSAAWAEGVTTQQTPETTNNSFYQSTIKELNQVTDEGDKTDLGLDWTKYLSVSGAFYTDAKAGDQTYDTQGENTNRLSVTNAHVTIQATPNTWSQFTLVTNYSDASNSYGANPDDAITSVGISNNADSSDNSVYIDQAYATFGDESRYPVFAQVGRQYLPFGQYDVNPVVRSLSQVLTETNATDAQIGFVTPEGLYGSSYVFQNPVSSDGDADETKPYNGGAVLGFKKSNEEMVFDTGVGYMNNMSGVDAIANYIDQDLESTGYGSGVAALAPYASFQTGPFGVNVDYVTALSYFDKEVLPYQTTSDNGAKPSAVDSQVSYAFNVKDMDQVLFIGYQVSNQASALNLPKKRYDVGYNIYPLKNVLVGLEVTRDTNYSASDGNIGNTADGEEYYTYNARVGVQF
ncbi:MAG: LbtU family siderophore porin [Gammaproteobacteria bacterium]|nr:LbtU family siderophore porin [Gammaproteobacteria bacterium]